jgi:hypothetical protein
MMFTRSTLAGLLLLSVPISLAIANECKLPAWPAFDSPAFKSALEADPRLRFTADQKYREDVATFVRCNRRSLVQRAKGMNASQVASLVREAHQQNESQIARAAAWRGCMIMADPTSAVGEPRMDCEAIIGLSERKPPPWPASHGTIAREEFRAFGGTWSYEVEKLDGPWCSHGPCGASYGLSLTNLTPVELLCNVSLRSIPRDNLEIRHVEQIAFVAPGQKAAATKLITDSLETNISVDASCEPKRWPQGMPANDQCGLQWIYAPSEYHRGLKRQWISGAAIVELTAQDRVVPTDLTIIDDNSVAAIGRNAVDAITRLRMYTNCPGQRFRVRIEFQTYPDDSPFEPGAITMFRE